MLELAIGIILAGCGIGAGLALIAGIGPGITDKSSALNICFSFPLFCASSRAYCAYISACCSLP